MNSTKIPIDELYEQLTAILQKEEYAKSTIQLYQEHVKRIKKFMLSNGITCYSPSVADQYYREEVEPRDYINTTKRYFRTVIRRLNDICSGKGFVYSVPRKDLSVPEQYHFIKTEYLEHCRKIGNRPITIKTKERLLHLFLTYLDENNCKSLDDINSSEIIRFSTDLVNKEFYPELRDFLRYLLVQGYVEKDFTTLVPKFNRGVRVPETYDVSEITEIENAVDRTSSPGKRDYAILLLASRLGIRAGDIASLKLNSLDFENQRIRFVQNKTGGVSDLYMIPEIKTALLDYLSTERPLSSSDHVFLKSFAPYTEISYSVVSFVVKKNMIRSGVNISGKKHGPHSLRSSLASSMVNGGVPYETVRKVLGHDSPNAIRHYARLDIRMLRNCALACPVPSGSLDEFLKGGCI